MDINLGLLWKALEHLISLGELEAAQAVTAALNKHVPAAPVPRNATSAGPIVPSTFSAPVNSDEQSQGVSANAGAS